MYLKRSFDDDDRLMLPYSIRKVEVRAGSDRPRSAEMRRPSATIASICGGGGRLDGGRLLGSMTVMPRPVATQRRPSLPRTPPTPACHVCEPCCIPSVSSYSSYSSWCDGFAATLSTSEGSKRITAAPEFTPAQM